MAVPLLDLNEQHATLLPRLREVFDRTLAGGRFILGPEVQAFEAQLAAYCGASHALAVSSGTDALLLAMMAMGIGPGDEVITTPFTFFATAGCVARLGATPVFVDIDPVSFNMNPNLIERAITPRTRAIIPVHLYGQAAAMGKIMPIARQHGLRVIEDAAQAIGARDGEQMVGSIGDVGCLSFYPSKNLAALGDAGAVTTNDPALHERMKMLRVHGEETKYHHTFVGGNFRLDALQASWLSVKLPHLDGWAARRRENARRYHELLAGLPLVLPTEGPGGFHVFNQFTVRVTDGRRDALRKHLAARSIGHEVYYPVPMHLQECFAELGGKAGDFPQAERAAGEVLSLPIFPEMTRVQQDEVAAAVREFFSVTQLETKPDRAATAGDPIIRLVDVHKSFGPLRVLAGVSLELHRGQTTVIMGPSGTGKSVLIKHIVGLIKPDRGEVWFHDKRIDRLKEHDLVEQRTRMGFLFQMGALFDSMNVGENVAFPLIEHTKLSDRERRTRCDHVLAMVGLRGSEKKMPADLSGGQKKRVALARAIVLEPEVVLYDEPTTGLDPIRSDVINELIIQLSRRVGITSVVVTHDMASANKIADRMVMLYDGKIIADGDPKAFHSSGNDVVQRFIAGKADQDDLDQIKAGIDSSKD